MAVGVRRVRGERMVRFEVGARVRVMCHLNSKFRGRLGKITDIKTDFPEPRTVGVTGHGELPTTGRQNVYLVSLDEPGLGFDALHNVREAWLERVE